MQGYLPALEGMTEDALATLYDTYCRLECAPPLPVVQCIARYLVGQLEYPTNLVKFLTPMTPNHMAVIRGDMPTSWDDACDVNLQWMLEEPNRRITHTRFTVAHFAALIGHIGIVRAIPDAAVRDHLTTHGSTVLYVAALGNPSPTRLACVQCILSRGLSPEQIGAASANGVTPLYVAGESGNLDVAKTNQATQLAERGQNISAQQAQAQLAMEQAQLNSQRQLDILRSVLGFAGSATPGTPGGNQASLY